MSENQLIQKVNNCLYWTLAFTAFLLIDFFVINDHYSRKIIIQSNELDINSTINYNNSTVEHDLTEIIRLINEKGSCLKLRMDSSIKERTFNMIFFTKIPKTGSTTMAHIIHILTATSQLYSGIESNVMGMFNKEEEEVNLKFV